MRVHIDNRAHAGPGETAARGVGETIPPARAALAVMTPANGMP